MRKPSICVPIRKRVLTPSTATMDLRSSLFDYTYYFLYDGDGIYALLSLRTIKKKKTVLYAEVLSKKNKKKSSLVSDEDLGFNGFFFCTLLKPFRCEFYAVLKVHTIQPVVPGILGSTLFFND